MKRYLEAYLTSDLALAVVWHDIDGALCGPDRRYQGAARRIDWGVFTNTRRSSWLNCTIIAR